MEVIYSAEGHQTMHIGARLPFDGEALEDVIKAFAPVSLWIERATPVVAPPVGLTGTVKPEPELIAVQTPIDDGVSLADVIAETQVQNAQ